MYIPKGETRMEAKKFEYDVSKKLINRYSRRVIQKIKLKLPRLLFLLPTVTSSVGGSRFFAKC